MTDTADWSLFKEPRAVPAVEDGIALPFLLFKEPVPTGGVMSNTFDPRRFIKRAPWKLSSTTVDLPDWRHFYIVQANFRGKDAADFRRFVKLIAEEGYEARFEGSKYRYLRVDSFLYWTSRSLYAPGVNLNRRPASDVEGRPELEQERLPV
jgi:hypothetical protein